MQNKLSAYKTINKRFERIAHIIDYIKKNNIKGLVVANGKIYSVFTNEKLSKISFMDHHFRFINFLSVFIMK